MRILYLEGNLHEARKRHSQLLAYTGIHWELQHCDSVATALDALSHEAIDLVLVGLGAGNEIESNLTYLLDACVSIPKVALLNAADISESGRWLALGFSDCLANENLDGEVLMRRMRIAEARHRRLKKEHYIVQLRQSFAIANASDSEPAVETFESIRLSRVPSIRPELRVAILTDSQTPRLLEDKLAIPLSVVVFQSVNDYVLHLQSHPDSLDCTLVEQALYEREGEHAFCRPELKFPGPPILLLVTDRSDAGALYHVKAAFDDCITVADAANTNLIKPLMLASRRHLYGVKAVREAIEKTPKVSERRKKSRTGADRRTAVRYLVTRPLLAIPVLPDGSPDRAGVRDAVSIDISEGGIGFQISNHSGIPSRNWVIGVACNSDDGQNNGFHYANVLVRNVSYPDGGVRMGSRFHSEEMDLFSPDRLTPRLGSQSGRFEQSLSNWAIEQWIELGVMKRDLLYRVQACPDCTGIVTMGRGCRECGSPKISFAEQIHHYACAHVAEAEAFGFDDDRSCPKCSTSNLVAVADFEVIHADYECGECRFDGSKVENVGTCLGCRTQFPWSQANEEEVYGYTVDRLDILELLSATQ